MITRLRLIAISAATLAVLSGAGILLLRAQGNSASPTNNESGTSSQVSASGGEIDDEAGSEERSVTSRGLPADPEDFPWPEFSFDPGQFKGGELDLELIVTPTCAPHGETMTAFLKAVPGAQVALQVSYAGAQGHGAYYVGPVSPDGTLTYPWAIPPEAQEGQGLVFVVARDEEDRSGSVAAEFRVVKSGNKC